jgi:hypothetical protein
MTLENISLLPLDKYRERKDIIPPLPVLWWLKDHSSLTFMCAVKGDQETRSHIRSETGVRPYCTFALETSDAAFWADPAKLIGTTFVYKNYDWVILDAEYGKVFALCLIVVGYHVYDGRSIEWDGSAIKTWLNTEFLNHLQK